MTSKGTFTLPAKVRKELGLTKPGQKLMLTFHPLSKTVSLTAEPDFAALRSELRPLATPNFDVEAILQKKRTKSIERFL